MKKTKIVMILDKSGSMHELTKDTIGGYNSFLEDQRKDTKNDIYITTVFFDHNYEILHDNKNIREIKNITNEYQIGGATALNDAIGKTINSVGNELNNMKEEDRPENILFVIITDGQENSSKEFSTSKIKEMITHQQEKYNWKFMYLGANVDSFHESSNLGINIASNYSSNSKGVRSVYENVTSCVNAVKSGNTISSEDFSALI